MKVGGRFCVKRCGPSRRRERKASVVPINFVRHQKRLFQHYLPKAKSVDLSITSSAHSASTNISSLSAKIRAELVIVLTIRSTERDPIAFFGACFWVDGREQTSPNQDTEVVLLAGGPRERVLELRIL